MREIAEQLDEQLSSEKQHGEMLVNEMNLMQDDLAELEQMYASASSWKPRVFLMLVSLVAGVAVGHYATKD